MNGPHFKNKSTVVNPDGSEYDATTGKKTKPAEDKLHLNDTNFSLKLMVQIDGHAHSLKMHIDDDMLPFYDGTQLINDVCRMAQMVARQFEADGVLPKSEVSRGAALDDFNTRQALTTKISLLRELLENDNPARPLTPETQSYLEGVLEDLSGIQRTEESRLRKLKMEHARAGRRKNAA